MGLQLFDDDTTLSDHPVITALTDAAKTTSQGIKDAMHPTATTATSPERWGPINGPAPNTDTERSHIVTFDITDPTSAETHSSPARVQFWTPRGGGGIFASWEIDDQSGNTAVFDRENSRLWFGTNVYWTNQGKPRSYIDLTTPVEVELWDGFSSLMYAHQSRTVGIHTADPPAETVTFQKDPAHEQHPCGPIIDVPVTGPRITRPARLQPWCDDHGGAVYIAWQVGSQDGRYGIMNAAGLWIGNEEQLIGPSGVSIPFIYIDAPDVKKALEDAIIETRTQRGTDDVPLHCGAHKETITSSHPAAPGNQHPALPE